MLTRTLASMLTLTALCAVTVIASDAVVRERQFQTAIELLQDKGDLAGAARLFEQVAGNTPDALGARALLYLAETYKRQGKEQDEIAVHQRILNRYAVHTQVAAKARERLTTLQGPGVLEPEGMKKQDGTEDDADAWAHLTPDGKLLSRADLRVTGDVIIRNMRTGERTRLKAKADTLETSNDHVELPIVSPDGSKVAYVWIFRDSDRNRVQLRLMPNRQGAPSRVLVEDKSYLYFEPIGWAPDGNAVLVTAWRSQDVSEFVWVSLAEQRTAVRVLKQLGRRLGPSRPRLSGDGRYVAYSAQPQEPATAQEWRAGRTNGPLHLYVLRTDQSEREQEVVRGSSVNESPVWAPEDRKLLFVSNQSTDGFGVWSVDIDSSGAARVGSETFLDSANISDRIRPVGMTRGGTLYYVPEQRGGVDVYHARLDPVTGRIVDAGLRLIDTVVDRSQAPSWSPDGSRVVFKRRPAADSASPLQEELDIVIYSVATRTIDKTHRSSQVDASQAIWLKDDRYLLVRRRSDGGLFRLRAADGELRRIEEVVRTRLPPECGSHVLSKDGRTLYLSVLDPIPADVPAAGRPTYKRSRRLVALDMETGDQAELMKTQKVVAMSLLAISPNNDTLALAVMEEGWKRPRLMLMGVGDRRLRELTPAIVPRSGSWTRAGLLIAADGGERSEIVRVSVADGKVTPTGLDHARGQFFDVSPDGTHVVYSDRRRKAPPLWAYHRLMPAATTTLALSERLRAGR